MTEIVKDDIYKMVISVGLTILIFIGGVSISKMDKLQDNQNKFIEFMGKQNEKNINYKQTMDDIKIEQFNIKTELNQYKLYCDKTYMRIIK